MYCNQCASYSCIHLLQGIGGMAAVKQQKGAFMSELMMQHYRGAIPMSDVGKEIVTTNSKPQNKKKLLLIRK
jgi:hypothetical protein